MFTLQSFCFSPVQENTYLLYNESRECCIIDPGCYFPAEKRQLQTWIEENGLKPVLLLNTHCHLDHVFGNQFVAETWGLTLHIHTKEKPLLDFAPQSGKMWNLPFDNYEGEIVYLNPGEKTGLGKDELEIRLVPGHSPGSLAFYSAADGFVISGDALFRGSIGRTDLPGGDMDTLLASIRNELFTLPEETVVYAGHGEPTTIGKEMRTNPFLV